MVMVVTVAAAEVVVMLVVVRVVLVLLVVVRPSRPVPSRPLPSRPVPSVRPSVRPSVVVVLVVFLVRPSRPVRPSVLILPQRTQDFIERNGHLNITMPGSSQDRELETVLPEYRIATPSAC